ncbi:MAG: tRNA 4-thiouridine(8) synthase ThiI [Lachnospiraceae bacterium]|jgi:thiamine biosynthesis protein ThiI|nr:tRNA 4-thiouridine(8) synthase ThiI [Lachnospiraceae bacterium]
MYKAFLLKYAEIGLKGKNRNVFENALRDRVQETLARLGEYRVVREQGRIFVECPDNFDYEETVDALKTVFGVFGISPVVVIDSTDWEQIIEGTGRYIEQFYQDKNFTFKVEAKRASKLYPLTTPEICASMGEYLLNRFPQLRVDVHDPKERICIEVRTKTYVYSKTIKGPGGMPVGTGGKAMLLLSGGIDSPVAGYMIAKRGVAIEATYFHAPPYTSERAKQKVVDLARIISDYTGAIRLHIVNFTDIQLEIYEKCPHEELTIIMRRYMMRIAEHFAKKDGCLGLITGESIGQVASQTMQSLIVTNAVCELPVLRPVIGFDKQEIVTLAKEIGTFETSIEPYEDCCTIFVAKHPVTKPLQKVIEASEKLLGEKIEELVETAVKTAEIIEIMPDGGECA